MKNDKPIISRFYDPRLGHKLDDDAQLVQRALNPGVDTQPGIEFPRITIDGCIFALCAMLLVVIFLIWIHSIIGG
jgi:hypothetical protein